MIKSLYPEFQKWCKNGSIYIISDTHFDDEDCKLMNPNWITPKEQVDLINRHVQKNDCLIHLGDVGNPNYINALNVRKRVLLLGNHDRNASYYKDYFSLNFLKALGR